jgi:hypothetical protein
MSRFPRSLRSLQGVLARQNQALERAVQLPQAAANGAAAAVDAAASRQQDAAPAQLLTLPERKSAPWWLDTDAQVRVRAANVLNNRIAYDYSTCARRC